MSWKVLIAHAPSEEVLAERLAIPIQEAGYEVTHRGTVSTGESYPEEAGRALSAGGPVIVCATAKAMGTSWVHRLINAGIGNGERRRIFIARMEKDAYVNHIEANVAVAEYWSDPVRAIKDIIHALQKHFPLDSEKNAANHEEPLSTAYLDRTSRVSSFDPAALKEFRKELRDSAKASLPPDLEPIDFLKRSGLIRSGNLTATGVLLFGFTPTNSIPAATSLFSVHETRVKGNERTSPLYLRGTVTDQLMEVNHQILLHIGVHEKSRPGNPRPEKIYEYPMKAVREILANALVHRDYEDAQRNVHVHLYLNDRMEVLSPGTW